MARNPIFTIIAEISAEFYIQHTTTKTDIIEIFKPVFDKTQIIHLITEEEIHIHMHTYIQTHITADYNSEGKRPIANPSR